ncbi:MAG: PH domain-containing protein [Bythopirellula sp.]|nr:PH domain-containing protein [Bythopirellula sp.]
MHCPHCGEQIPRPSRFCQHCGGKLAQDQDQPDDTAPRKKLRSAANRGAADTVPEEELWHGSYSKLAMIGAWLGAGVMSLVSLALGLFGGVTGELWLAVIAINALVWAGLMIRYFYLRFSRHYTLTNQRFTHLRGLLWRQTDRIEVIDIDDVSFTQGPIERMLGIGTVRISSSDQSHPELALPGIENAQIVAGLIDDARRKERRRRGLYIESV